MATSTLSWVTVPGTIANFSIGNPGLVQLLAVDNKNLGTTFTYSKISGDLPPGMSINANGEISGTPIYSTLADSNYFTRQTYSFIVRALSSTSRAIDGSFTIIINNTVNQDFTWITPVGNLGTIPNGNFYSLKIEAQSSNNLGITYSFVSGELPPGMQLISHQVDKTVTTAQSVVSTTLNLSNVQTISINDFVFGSKIPTGCRVTDVDIDNKIVTLSANTTSAVAVGDVIKFYSPGLLQGVPTILDPVAVNESRTYRFTIRATSSVNHITDRAFSLNITNIYGPIIQPETTYLGSFFDGSYYEQQLSVTQLNPSVEIQWSIISGALPPGLNLDQNGLISGYVLPVDVTNPLYGPGGFDGYDVSGDIVTSQQQYDMSPYQFNQINSSIGYSFTVQAFDGANYDLQSYTINTIASRSGWTADNDLITVDDDYLGVDGDNNYYPFIRNLETRMTPGRQNSYYAFKIDGYDWDSPDDLTYRIVDTEGSYDGSPFDPLNETGIDLEPWDPLTNPDTNNFRPGSFDRVTTTSSNLPGVELDAETGWIYGKLNEQTTALEEYTFGIEVCKTVGNVEYCSPTKYFTLPVIGDPNSIITWISPEDLGTIDNGTVSEIVIEAESAVGKEIVYSLIDESGVSCRLPQGLSLLPTGEITGRATFEAFSLDDYTTTFDNEQLTIDRTSTFNVLAETTDQTTSVTRTFSLKLNVIDTEPYENLYLKAMPSAEQRQIYNRLISDTGIFDPEFIYRPTDPYYGVQEELKMLFLPGLTASELTEYQDAMIRNHFNKTYTFGDVKTAYVLDESYQVKYEVVYVEIKDPGETENNVGPELVTDLSNAIANPYYDATGNAYDIIYPNSSENMKLRMETNIGYQDQSSLPPWMSSNQPDATSATGFTIPLGYTKAVVIAYAKPGAGEKIAYRINKSNIDFNRIEFVVDRYQVDNYYSNHYDTAELTYLKDRETTFDADPNINIGTIVASVNYGVRVPFSQINGRPVDYIIANGGIDGVTDFRDGEHIIFVQQEQFEDSGPYDGWVDYSNSFIGDDVETSQIEGYDSGSYDTYTVIKGFLEKSQGTTPINYRGGVWQINITNDIVNLSFVQEIDINDRVRILFGKTLSSAVMIYSIELAVGQTVPYYKVFKVTPTIRQRTTFNNDTTKFFTYRDQYYEPGTQDKYVKFPQYGVFN